MTVLHTATARGVDVPPGRGTPSPALLRSCHERVPPYPPARRRNRRHPAASRRHPPRSTGRHPERRRSDPRRHPDSRPHPRHRHLDPHLRRRPEGNHAAVAGPPSPWSEQQLAAKGTYAARVTPQSSSAVGALAFWAALEGSTGYAVALDPGRARIRLYDLTGGDTLATAPLPGARTARPYDLEVAADGPELTVHVDGKRLLHTEDHRHDTGSMGLLAQGGTVTFGPPSVSAVTTNLTGWTTSGGTWTATPLGWRADPSQGTTTRAVTTTQAYDTALQADLLLHDTSAVAELLVRTDEAATRGYGVQVDPGHSRLRLYRIDRNVTLGTYATAIEADAVYRLRVEAGGTELRVHWQTNFLSPDGYSPVITAQDSTHTTGRLAVRASVSAVSFDNVAAAELVAQDGDLRAAHLIGQRGVHPAAERGDRHLQFVLVPQPLVNRGDRHRPEQVLDDVAVLVDVGPGDLPQSPVDEAGEPSLDQPGPVGLGHRRSARGDPGRLRRGQVLPDRLAVHSQRRGQRALRAARVPVDVDLGDVDHDERSPCHPGCPSACRTTGRGTQAAPR